MDALNKLMEYFGEFPGIGPRQARRFAYFLLTKNPTYTAELSRLIVEIKKNVHTCGSCFRFYTSNKNGPAPTASSANLCSICADTSRDHAELMIVARDVDLEAIEKSKTYRGLYFVLGGTVPILEKNPETRIRSRELMKRIEKNVGALNEIILSLNANPEGEHTVDVLRGLLKSFTEKNGQHNIKISILGRGLSTGSELEYSDSDTIKNALKNRA
jgi:recombination protein RecR